MAQRIWIGMSLATPALWLVLVATGHGHDLEPWVQASLSGLAIVGASFLLSWATELAEEDVPPAFALIVLALIAVLPEYAVDMHFAWTAAKDPSYLPYAVANMTGANRILIGLGWSVLVFLWCARRGTRSMEVDEPRRVELFFLLIATIYSLVLPLKGHLSLVDSAIFIGIFAAYVLASLRSEGGHQGELVGPARWMHERVGTVGRRSIVVVFLLYACVAIWYGAEPFADGLVVLGRGFHIDEFVLIQVVAPLASESPEFIVAILFVLRGRPSMGLGTLISSKVNQWTLLVGTIPIVYSLSAGQAQSMPLDARQVEELFLTSTQSLFAIAVLADLRFKLWEALVLCGLFAAQWFFPSPHARYIFAWAYVVMAVVLFVGVQQTRRGLLRLLWPWG